MIDSSSLQDSSSDMETPKSFCACSIKSNFPGFSSFCLPDFDRFSFFFLSFLCLDLDFLCFFDFLELDFDLLEDTFPLSGSGGGCGGCGCFGASLLLLRVAKISSSPSDRGACSSICCLLNKDTC